MKVEVFKIVQNDLEPVGGTKPKFSEDVNFKGIAREIAKSVTLTCPAQSYPTPAFRQVSFV